MRFLTGPKVFVTLLAFFALGVIVTLDPAAVVERHKSEAMARSSQYSEQHSSAYAHFRGAPGQSDQVGSLAYYYYPAYRHPVVGQQAGMTVQDASRIMQQAPTAAGDNQETQQATINELKVRMYEHAGQLEFEEAAKLRDQIRSLEKQ